MVEVGWMMLTRIVLMMMLLLAGWMPFQSVVAWASMSHSDDVTSSTLSMPASKNVSVLSDACHTTKSMCDHRNTMVDHHSVQCAYCGSAYSASTQLPEIPAQGSEEIQTLLPLYNDHIPLLLSPPPVIVTA